MFLSNIIGDKINVGNALNQNDLGQSIERFSSGVKINSASDDGSGLAIADQLNTHGNMINQMAKNNLDEIGMLLIADKAIEQQVNILDSIKMKAVRMSSDSMTSENRKILQTDINKLLTSFDNISETTSYQDKKLLSGATTIRGLNIASTNSSKIGHTSFLEATSNLPIDANDAFGKVGLELQDHNGNMIKVTETEIGYKKGQGLGALADNINALTSKTGVRATYEVNYEYSAKHQAVKGLEIIQGDTETDAVFNARKATITLSDMDFSILLNGEAIFSDLGSVQDNDKNQFLINSINDKTSVTGVSATLDKGSLQLKSETGQAIFWDIELSNKDIANGQKFKRSEVADDNTLTHEEKVNLNVNMGTVMNKLFTMKITGDTSVESPLAVEKNGSVIYNEDLERYEVGTDLSMNNISFPSVTNLPPTKKIEFAYTDFDVSDEYFKIFKTKDYAQVRYDLIENGDIVGTSSTKENLTADDWKKISDELTKRVDGTSTLSSDKIEQIAYIKVGNGSGSNGFEIESFNSTYIKDYDVSDLKHNNSLGKGSIEFKDTGDTFYMDAKGANLQMEYMHIYNEKVVPMATGKLKLTGVNNATNIKVGGSGLDYINLSNGNSTVQGLSNISGAMDTKATRTDSLNILDSALIDLLGTRSDIGSKQNELTTDADNYINMFTNLKSAESNIRDLDFAKESMNFSKHNVLNQMGNYAYSMSLDVLKEQLKILI